MAQVDKLLIFLASPGDVKTERRYAQEVVDELNRTIAPGMNVVLDVVKWEEDAVPGYGKDAQALINEQIGVMGNYSLFVGIMWNRFGTPTSRAESGTEEEFERAIAALAQHGQPAIWVYFRDPKANFDEEQLKQWGKVLALKKRIEADGMPSSYKTPPEFKNKFREHLSIWLRDRALKSQTKSEKEGAQDLTGDWIIDDGNSQYDVRLKQAGSHVSGEYDLPGGTGFLDGLVEGNQVTLSWDQQFNRRGGEARMEISSDGQKLDGKWNYNPTKYSSGLTSKGKWTFYKK